MTGGTLPPAPTATARSTTKSTAAKSTATAALLESGEGSAPGVRRSALRRGSDAGDHFIAFFEVALNQLALLAVGNPNPQRQAHELAVHELPGLAERFSRRQRSKERVDGGGRRGPGR